MILLSGLPGSGKNTWAANHVPHLPTICLDDIRRELKISPQDNQGKVLQAAKEQAKKFLRAKQSFVWNATNLIRLRRRALVDLFTTYQARVKIIYLETPYQDLLERNRTREESIPTQILERFIDRMEIPERTEAHEVVYF